MEIFSNKMLKTNLKHLWPFLLILTFFSTIVVINCGKSSVSNKKNSSEGNNQFSSQSKIARNDTLIRALSSDPEFLNPVLSNDNPSSLVEYLIYDQLLDVDDTTESNIVGRLAERWEISDDKSIITFFLRKGITWQDGFPFSAEDVKFTFDMASRNDIPAVGMKSVTKLLDKLEVINDYQIKFYFKQPIASELLRIGTNMIIPKHRLDEKGLMDETRRRGLKKPVTFVTSDFNRYPLGTGPYIIRKWKTAQYIKLERNKKYWDKDNSPYIKNVLIKIVPSPTVAFNLLLKNELDLFRARPNQYLRFKRMKKLQANFKSESFYEPSYYYIGWNNRPSNHFFNNKVVRTAMTNALDRESFIKKAYYGLGKVISGPFYFKSWAYNKNVKPLKYNPQKAVELLASAGWIDRDGDGILDKNGRKFKIELLIPSGSAGFAQLAAILQADLAKLSIKVDIRMYEWSVYLQRLRKGDFQAYIGGWSLGIDPDPYAIWHSAQIGQGNNLIGFRNDEVDKLIEQGRRIFDRKKRQKIYWKIHELINSLQPYTFVYTPQENYILSKKITNYSVSPFGLFEFFPGQLSWKLK